MGLKLNLRAKALIFSLIPFALMVVSLGCIWLYAHEQVTRDLALRHTAEVANITAARISEGLARFRRRLQEIAAKKDVQAMKPERITSAIEKAWDLLYVFDAGVAVYDAKGAALCKHPFSDSRLDKDFPLATEFETIQTTRTSVFSNIFQDPASQEAVILVAVPILGKNNEFRGVLTGFSTLQYSLIEVEYAKALEIKAGHTGYAFLVDGNGWVIHDRRYSRIGKKADAKVPVMKVARGETGAMFTEDSAGKSIVCGYAPVPGTSWGTVVQEKWDVIIEPIQKYNILLLGMLAGGCVISGALIFFGIGHTLKPIKELTVGAQEIAKGGFEHFISAKTGDEIQDLAEQFNKMAGTLKTSYTELERRVMERTVQLEERTSELEETNVRLQEADRLKSVFLASMSHELRTPLNSIIGFTGIILQGIAGEINEEQKKQLNMVKNSGNHLLGMINDLLDIAKIEAGRVDLSLETFEIHDVITEVAEGLSPAVEEKGLELSVDVPEGITFASDRRRVKQVLMNFLSNAVKFTDKGNIKITAGVYEDDMIEIRIIDTGIGIEEQDRHKLFQPFQQIDTSLTKRHEGTGLGLHLTRKLADLLGGNVQAKSESGKGSEFIFRVPITPKGQDRNEP